MGSCPSADLYWGYDLGDLTDPDTYESLAPSWMDDAVDDEEQLARRLGWVEVPWPNLPVIDPEYRMERDERRRLENEQHETAEYRAWLASRAEMRRLIASIPVELGWYGWLEDSSKCVRVKASVQTAPDYGSVALLPLVVAPEWAGQVAEFMRLLELPIPAGAEPAWHMNCSYG